ncbi:MAG: flagellar protein FlgN [Thiomicrorhabdus sp.]|nr:flagellar protein FlgN [Thiomicrorhabdus sp.]
MTQDQANRIQKIEQLPSQIAQFLQLLETFHETLLSESQALKSNNTDQLSTTILVKSELTEKISLLTQSIENQLKTQQLSLSALLSSTLPSNLPQAMQQNIQRLILLSNQCHDLNQANGISIQILNNINQQTIKIISGQEPPNVKLYGATGETQTSASAKNPLGKA